jgi:hypothetical protein
LMRAPQPGQRRRSMESMSRSPTAESGAARQTAGRTAGEPRPVRVQAAPARCWRMKAAEEGRRGSTPARVLCCLNYSSFPFRVGQCRTVRRGISRGWRGSVSSRTCDEVKPWASWLRAVHGRAGREVIERHSCLLAQGVLSGPRR